MLLQTVIEVVC